MSDMTFSSEHWPTEVRYEKAEKALHVTFDNGEEAVLAAELLRVESPSAEVQGHDPAEKQTVPGKRDVAIIGIEPVGNYAVKLTFDDLHDTGLYSWDFLYKMGRNKDKIWADYLAALDRQGLSRDP